MFNAIYKIPALKFTCTNVFTTKTLTDAYRGAGRPEATFAIERMMDELAVELGPRPDGAARAELDQARGVPVHHGRGPHLRLGQLRAGHRAGHVHVRLRGTAPRAGGAARERRPGPARHRHLDVHRDVRDRPVAPAGLAGLRRGRLGGCVDPDAGHRQGRGRHRRVPARAGARDGVQPDRRRPARRAASRTSRSCTATPRSRRRAWTPTARARWSSAASPSSTRRRRSIGKAKKLAAHLLEASEDDLEFADGRFAVKGTDKGLAIQEVVFGRVHRARLPGGHGAQPRLGRRVRPGELLLPARHAPARASRSTPRPGTSTCASTSAWTTSATWSTR